MKKKTIKTMHCVVIIGLLVAWIVIHFLPSSSLAAKIVVLICAVVVLVFGEIERCKRYVRRARCKHKETSLAPIDTHDGYSMSIKCLKCGKVRILIMIIIFMAMLSAGCTSYKGLGKTPAYQGY